MGPTWPFALSASEFPPCESGTVTRALVWVRATEAQAPWTRGGGVDQVGVLERGGPPRCSRQLARPLLPARCLVLWAAAAPARATWAARPALRQRPLWLPPQAHLLPQRGGGGRVLWVARGAPLAGHQEERPSLLRPVHAAVAAGGEEPGGRGRVWISRGRGAVGLPHCRLGPCRPCLFCQGAPRQSSPGRPAWDLSLLHFAKSDKALLMLFSDGTLQVGGACPRPEWAGRGGWPGVSPEVKPPKGREVGLCTLEAHPGPPEGQPAGTMPQTLEPAKVLLRWLDTASSHKTGQKEKCGFRRQPEGFAKWG